MAAETGIDAHQKNHVHLVHDIGEVIEGRCRVKDKARETPVVVNKA